MKKISIKKKDKEEAKEVVKREEGSVESKVTDDTSTLKRQENSSS
jgi:hypothetical protein